MLNKSQLLVVLSSVVLFLVLYFGCSTSSKEDLAKSSRRGIKTESVESGSANVSEMISSAKNSLSAAQNSEMESLGKSVTDAGTQEAKIAGLKKLSGAWHQAGKEEVAAIYAEQVAESEKTETAWALAGGNYYLALKAATDKGIRDFCSGHAVVDFQNAASLNPSNLEHKINIALCYVENPPQDNPMRAVLLLQDLERQNPDSMLVPIQLARLAMKTGQFERAQGRLEKVLLKEPNNMKAICLLAEAYQKTGNAKAAEFSGRCK